MRKFALVVVEASIFVALSKDSRPRFTICSGTMDTHDLAYDSVVVGSFTMRILPL